MRVFHSVVICEKPPSKRPCKQSRQFYQYLVSILAPVTDNCPSWISRRERMVVEMFSWPNLNERMFCQTWGSNPQLSAYLADMHPIELPRPAWDIKLPWHDPCWYQQFQLLYCVDLFYPTSSLVMSSNPLLYNLGWVLSVWIKSVASVVAFHC